MGTIPAFPLLIQLGFWVEGHLPLRAAYTFTIPIGLNRKKDFSTSSGGNIDRTVYSQGLIDFIGVAETAAERQFLPSRHNCHCAISPHYEKLRE
jgi:hypothetical protein